MSKDQNEVEFLLKNAWEARRMARWDEERFAQKKEAKPRKKKT